jgi:enterochelin esterase-like enzyme
MSTDHYGNGQTPEKSNYPLSGGGKMFLKKSFVALLAFSVVFAPAAFQRVHAQAPTLIHTSSYSKYMGNKQWWFNIYLPPSYSTSPTKRYPVIYFLHGAGADENQFTYYATTFVHSYIQQNKVPEVIVVFPSGGGQTWFLDSGIFATYAMDPDSYIIKELIPHIDSTYRTIADRASRVISGMSMGGYGTWHFAFKYPQLFCCGGVFSAGGPYVGNTIVQNYSPAEDPHKLAVSNAAILSAQMKVYVCVGGNDGLTAFNQDLVNICKAQKIPNVYTVVPNIGHDFNGLMQNNGLQAVQYVTQGFAPVSIRDRRASTSAGSDAATISLQGRTLRIGAPHALPLTIELFSLSGRMAVSYQANGQSASLDLSGYAMGNYLVRMRGAFGTLEKRIMVMP